MWKWARMLFCIVKWLRRRSPPVCKDILKWKPGRNENLIFTSSSHWSLPWGGAMRMMRGEARGAGREGWECRCQPLPWDGFRWVHMRWDGFGWILKDFRCTSLFKRRLCASSPKLEDIRDPALVEGRLRPQADAGQVEVPGGEQAIQVSAWRGLVAESTRKKCF